MSKNSLRGGLVVLLVRSRILNAGHCVLSLWDEWLMQCMAISPLATQSGHVLERGGGTKLLVVSRAPREFNGKRAEMEAE